MHCSSLQTKAMRIPCVRWYRNTPIIHTKFKDVKTYEHISAQISIACACIICPKWKVHVRLPNMKKSSNIWASKMEKEQLIFRFTWNTISNENYYRLTFDQPQNKTLFTSKLKLIWIPGPNEYCKTFFQFQFLEKRLFLFSNFQVVPQNLADSGY